MVIEDIKEPCIECVHEKECLIRHPELVKENPESLIGLSCEKLNKFSSYVATTRPPVY